MITCIGSSSLLSLLDFPVLFGLSQNERVCVFTYSQPFLDLMIVLPIFFCRFSPLGQNSFFTFAHSTFLWPRQSFFAISQVTEKPELHVDRYTKGGCSLNSTHSTLRLCNFFCNSSGAFWDNCLFSSSSSPFSSEAKKASLFDVIFFWLAFWWCHKYFVSEVNTQLSIWWHFLFFSFLWFCV